MRRILVLVMAVFLFASVAFADGLPDPIISPRAGGGSTAFNGQITLYITVAGNVCGDPVGGVYTCGTPAQPVVALTEGGDDTLFNNTGVDITNLLYQFFATSDMTPFPEAPFSTDYNPKDPLHSSIFEFAVPYPSPDSTTAALLFGGGFIGTPPPCEFCEVAALDGAAPFEWTNNFIGINVPTGGLTVVLTSNVPEPGTLPLLLSGIGGALWWGRKRLIG